MKKFQIKHEDGSPYLTRYILLIVSKFRLFLHRIHTADPQKDEHCHPWLWAKSIILWGGYTEEVVHPQEYLGNGLYAIPLRKLRQHGFLSVNHITHDMYHKIIHVKPNTWTLFIGGKKATSWGFLVNGKHVDYREYLGLPADHELDD